MQGHSVLCAWSSLLLLLLLLLGACGVAQPKFPVQSFRVGDLDTMQAFAQKELESGEPANEALVQNVLGQCNLLRGARDEARRHFATAYQIMGSWAVEGSEVYAALFGNESSKTYRGDPYERMLNSFYLALTDLWHGEPDNARACMISAMLADAENSQIEAQADNPLLFWMAGRMGRLANSADVEEFFADARKANENALQRNSRGSADNPLLSNPAAGNVVVLAAVGLGPEKYGGGFGDSIARFRPVDHPAKTAQVSIDGREIGRTSVLMDVDFQATTYKGEAMEGVRMGKAVVKTTLAIAGVEVAKDAMRERDSEKAAAKAAVAGVLFLFAWLISSDADDRHWPTVPSTIQALTADVAPGRHELTVDFLDASGRPLANLRQNAAIEVPARGEAWYLAASIGGPALVGPGIPARAPATAPQP